MFLPYHCVPMISQLSLFFHCKFITVIFAFSSLAVQNVQSADGPLRLFYLVGRSGQYCEWWLIVCNSSFLYCLLPDISFTAFLLFLWLKLSYTLLFLKKTYYAQKSWCAYLSLEFFKNPPRALPHSKQKRWMDVWEEEDYIPPPPPPTSQEVEACPLYIGCHNLSTTITLYTFGPSAAAHRILIICLILLIAFTSKNGH